MRVRYRIDGVLTEAAIVPASRDPRGHLAHQDHGRPRHRRAPHPAGRPRHHAGRRARAIDLRVATLPAQYGEKVVMRILDTSKAMVEHREARHAAAGARALHQGLQPVPRRRARHRPDRLGQVDVALRGAQPAQHDRQEHHHHRGPGRVPARGPHPGAGQQEGGPHVRRRPALDDARRPRHHHGRRDPRPRDGPDRHRGGAHRPPRALHAAHERRAGRDHAA